MKKSKILWVLSLGCLNFIVIYGSSSPAEDLKDIELGAFTHHSKSGVLVQPHFSHLEVAQRIRRAGYDVPEKIFVAHLDNLIKSDPVQYSQLIKDFKITRKKHTIEGKDLSSDPNKDEKKDNQDLVITLEQTHLMKFISGAITAEIANNKDKADKDCNKIIAGAVVSGLSIIGNTIQVILNYYK